MVDNASGEYIEWVDSDVVLPKNYLRKQVEFMDRNPGVGAARKKVNKEAFIKDAGFRVD